MVPCRQRRTTVWPVSWADGDGGDDDDDEGGAEQGSVVEFDKFRVVEFRVKSSNEASPQQSKSRSSPSSQVSNSQFIAIQANIEPRNASRRFKVRELKTDPPLVKTH
jgi:hypothetical protein